MTTIEQEKMYHKWKEESKREWRKFNERLDEFTKERSNSQVS